LKGDIDSLKGELNIVNADVDDLRHENNGINDVINNRSGEIARLKAEITDVFDSNNRTQMERKELEGQLNRLRADNREHTYEIDDLSQKAAELTERKNKYERLIRELEIEREKQNRSDQSLNKQADNVRLEIRNKNEAIKYSENLLADCRKTIISLEADLNDLKRLNEKFRNDIVNTQKSQQSEFSKNLEITSHINRLEGLIAEREDEIAHRRREYEELKRDHLKLIDTNDDLNHDIEACTRHLDLLTLQNSDLVNELEKFNEQDERVRSILDRRDRVYEVKRQTEGQMKQSFHAMNSSIRSPGKRRNID
jgi:chromosome segregation ATPase